MNKTLTALGICIAACTLFFTISITGCKPEKTTTPSHCSNGVKDSDETGVDCGGSCDACGQTTLTTACFTLVNDTVAKDSTVVFTNCSQNATSYKWTFGDGASSTQQNPTHAYTASGTFVATLIATGAVGSDTVTKNVVVSLASAAFVGTFAGQDACTSGAYTYTANVTANGANSIVIDNFGGFGIPVNATVSGNNITIPSQTVSTYSFSGTGTLSANGQTMNITYIATDGSATDNCTTVYTRQ